MRIIVTGSRFWVNKTPIWEALAVEYEVTRHLVVVHGASADLDGNLRGADRWADEWANRAARLGLNVEVERWPADREQFRRAADPIRNRAMIAAGVWCARCKVEGKVLAWPLGDSPGTYGCMDIAEGAGITPENRADLMMRGLRHG